MEELTSGMRELVPCCDWRGKVAARPLQWTVVSGIGIQGTHGALVDARKKGIRRNKQVGLSV